MVLPFISQPEVPDAAGLSARIAAMEPAAEAFPAAQQAIAALQSALPTPSNFAPPATTATQPVLGTDTKMFALADHTHPSRVQSGTTSLNATGEAEWMFSVPFDDEPNMRQPTYVETADNLPIVFKIKDYWREKSAAGAVLKTLSSAGGTGKYIGVVVKGTRLSNTVTPQGVTVVGVNVLSALTINVAAGTNLTGIKVYLQAAPNS